MRRRSNRELWLSFFTILGITALYLFIVIMRGSIPAASEFFGHSLGILGFLLMVMTETLYSLRKRSRSHAWGKMSTWLQFHIFTGLVGPYMVLLHTAWKFNGLAGIVMLLTTIIVASGFIGRYIYTAIPRTADGAEMEAAQVQQAVAAVETELNRWMESQPDNMRAFSQRITQTLPPVRGGDSWAAVIGRAFTDFGYRLQWWAETRKANAATKAKLRELDALLKRQRTLKRQVQSLAMARQMLALWHAVHIPIGMALFTAAAIHIGAAIYYATLLK
ncbi:MAG: hypothetical protein Fur0018_01780 [Anaerolineales bacterium]